MLYLPAADADPAAGNGPRDYDAVANDVFWSALHGDGGWTLYCGERFSPDRRGATGKSVVIDHVYPVAAMLEHLGCRTRLECRERKDGRFREMEADMHNLYPVWQPLVTFRNGRGFGIVDGEDWRFEDCDVEWGNGSFEPRAIARGNVARAMLYMHDTWKLPLDPALNKMLRRWHRDDPPSRQEQLRNDAIEKLQGRRNRWIDRPAGGGRATTAAD